MPPRRRKSVKRSGKRKPVKTANKKSHRKRVGVKKPTTIIGMGDNDYCQDRSFWVSGSGDYDDDDYE